MQRKTVHFNFQNRLNRRTVLRGTGVALGLPWLTAMRPAYANDSSTMCDGDGAKRFVAVTLGLGLVAENLNPKEAGVDYQPSRYLRELTDLRDKVTVVSGSSHPDVTGGHRAEASILTATPMGTAGRAVNSISIDQYLAKHLGDATRYPSLVLATGGSNSPCYTDNGSMIPPQASPARLFADLFVDESKKEQTKQAQRVQQGRSIMDLVAEDAKSLQRDLGSADRDRLDAYFSSVRQFEQRMQKAQQWAMLPKPEVDAKQPVDIQNPHDLVGRMKSMCDVIKLALQTDSTRFVSLHLPAGGGVVPIEGVDEGYHSLSHHGKDEEKLDQLALVEEAIVGQWGEFLRELRSVDESQRTLLDSTSVMLTSNLGNASNHDNRNMPVLLAGGGFTHAGHLEFDKKQNYPLPNFFVSLAQNCGMEVDRFASSTGTMTGLELS